MNIRVILGLALAASVCAAEAKVTTATPFADNMVLQRERPVPVWGKADPGETVTVQFAVNPPSAVVAVIVAVPKFTAVTRPLALTVATELSLEVQLIFLFDALAGAMVALNGMDAPKRMRRDGYSRLTPVTGTNAAVS